MSQIEEVVVIAADIERLLRARGALGSGLRELADFLPDLPGEVRLDLDEVIRVRNLVVHQAHVLGSVQHEAFMTRARRVEAHLDALVAPRLPGIARPEVRPPPPPVIRPFIPPDVRVPAREPAVNAPQRAPWWRRWRRR